MTKALLSPRAHKDWIPPHSFAWYAQLASMTGKYAYSWKSTIVEPNAETMFEAEVAEMVRNKRVLDIGCGHGEFTRQWSPIVEQIIGIDVTDDFVKSGNAIKRDNVSFVQVNTKNRLPFVDDQFDCAYNRKGPTSAYLDIKRIIRQGGQLLGLHPGDASVTQLNDWFPVFFDPKVEGTPVLDMLRERLAQSGFNAEIEIIRSIEYLHEPIDIIRLRCFGQSLSLFKAMEKECLSEITRIFERHSVEQGLPVTSEHYLVRVKV